jgi:hypothetical protein
MIISRRAMIASGGVALGAIAIASARVKAPAITLHIHDSRLPNIHRSQLAQTTHDIANEEAQLWRASRTLNVARGDVVTGETRWSDWVALRGVLAERGLRQRSAVVHETIAGTIVVWKMG